MVVLHGYNNQYDCFLVSRERHYRFRIWNRKLLTIIGRIVFSQKQTNIFQFLAVIPFWQILLLMLMSERHIVHKKTLHTVFNTKWWILMIDYTVKITFYLTVYGESSR